MNRRVFRAAIVNGDARQNIFRPGLGVFHKHVEVTVVIKNARVEEFKFGLTRNRLAPRIFLHKLVVRKGPLRILVEHLEIRMRRGRVEVVIQFLHVFAVIALRIRQAEQPFLENRILAVPQRQRETEVLFVVADAGDAVFAPAISPAARIVMRKIIPRRAARRIIFAHRAPLPFGKIRAEKFPLHFAGMIFREPLFFRIHVPVIDASRLYFTLLFLNLTAAGSRCRLDLAGRSAVALAHRSPPA